MALPAKEPVNREELDYLVWWFCCIARGAPNAYLAHLIAMKIVAMEANYA